MLRNISLISFVMFYPCLSFSEIYESEGRRVATQRRVPQETEEAESENILRLLHQMETLLHQEQMDSFRREWERKLYETERALKFLNRIRNGCIVILGFYLIGINVYPLFS